MSAGSPPNHEARRVRAGLQNDFPVLVLELFGGNDGAAAGAHVGAKKLVAERGRPPGDRVAQRHRSLDWVRRFVLFHTITSAVAIFDTIR
jgi:hypothetical protein